MTPKEETWKPRIPRTKGHTQTRSPSSPRHGGTDTGIKGEGERRNRRRMHFIILPVGFPTPCVLKRPKKVMFTGGYCSKKDQENICWLLRSWDRRNYSLVRFIGQFYIEVITPMVPKLANDVHFGAWTWKIHRIGSKTWQHGSNTVQITSRYVCIVDYTCQLGAGPTCSVG